MNNIECFVETIDAHSLEYSSRQPSEERLKLVKTPTLVIIGTKDPDFPDPIVEGRYIAVQIGGKLEMVEGTGHYPKTEMPEKTRPVVLGFLNRSVSGSTPANHKD